MSQTIEKQFFKCPCCGKGVTLLVRKEQAAIMKKVAERAENDKRGIEPVGRNANVIKMITRIEKTVGAVVHIPVVCPKCDNAFSFGISTKTGEVSNFTKRINFHKSKSNMC